MPTELKEQFDLVSEDLCYNDQFWKEGGYGADVIVGIGSIDQLGKPRPAPRNSSQSPPRKGPASRSNEPEIATERNEKRVSHLTSAWLSKMLRVRENKDRRCTCCGRVHCLKST